MLQLNEFKITNISANNIDEIIEGCLDDMSECDDDFTRHGMKQDI